MIAAFLIPLLAGLLLAWSFFPAPAHWLAWIALVPFAAAMTARNHRAATYVGTYFAGLAFNLITTDWIRTLDGGVGLSGRSAPDWLFQAELLAGFWPLSLWLGRLLLRIWPLPMCVALPVVWTAHELLLRTLWAAIDQTGWQIYRLGYALAEHPWIVQIADLGGVSILSILGAAVSGAIWDLSNAVRQRRSRTPSLRVLQCGSAGVLVLVVISAAYGYYRTRQTRCVAGPAIALMPQEALADCEATGQQIAQLPGRPDLLLWSELAYHGPEVKTRHGLATEDDGPSQRTVEQQRTASRVAPPEHDLGQRCRALAVPMVVGYTRTLTTPHDELRFNSAAFVEPNRGFVDSYDKVGLVPWTEFTPIQGLTRRKAQQFSHGSRYPVFRLSGEGACSFAAAICYDIAFPAVFRRYMRASSGPPDLFVMCSSERSDHTGSMSRHVLAMTKVRAVESRRAVVRNVHRGYSGIVDSTGRYWDASIPSVLTAPVALPRVPLDDRYTLYVAWGDWIPRVLAGFLAILAAGTLSRRLWRAARGQNSIGSL